MLIKEQLPEERRPSILVSKEGVMQPEGRQEACWWQSWDELDKEEHNQVVSYHTPVAWKQHLLIAIFLFRFNNDTLKKPSITWINWQRRSLWLFSIKYSSIVILFIDSQMFFFKYTCQAIWIENMHIAIIPVEKWKHE